MPGMKTWAVGEEVLAADFNSYLQTQVVAQFPDVATRDAQWLAPPNGAYCVTLDTNTMWQRRAGVWTRPWNSGITTAGTDANGDSTINHGLGRAPTSISVTMGVGGAFALAVVAADATTMRIRAYVSNTGATAPNNAGIRIYWFVT